MRLAALLTKGAGMGPVPRFSADRTTVQKNAREYDIGLDMNKIFEKSGNEYREIPSYKKVFQCAFYPEPFRFCTDKWQLDTWIESDERDSSDDLWTEAIAA